MTPGKQRALVIGLIVLGVLVVGFFGLRTLRAFRDFRGHRPPPPFAPADNQTVETDVELIRDWMTIGFISHNYHTHPRMLYDALNIQPKGNEDKSLQQLNDEFYPDQPGYVLETVKSVIRSSLPPSTPSAPAAP